MSDAPQQPPAERPRYNPPPDLRHLVVNPELAQRCREAFKAQQAAKPRWVGKPKRKRRK